MGRWEKAARRRLTEWDRDRQSLREVKTRLETLRARILDMKVWALLTGTIPQGTVVWYLGKWYRALQEHRKSVLDTPPGSENWELLED